jgi:hypothetical protein
LAAFALLVQRQPTIGFYIVKQERHLQAPAAEGA